MARFQWLAWCQLKGLGGWGRDNFWVTTDRRFFNNWRREFEWHLQNPKPKDRPLDDPAYALGA